MAPGLEEVEDLRVTEDLQETCDAAEDEIIALEANLEEAVANKTEAEGEVAALEAANAKLTAELKEAVADKTEAQGNVTTLEAKIAALEAAKASGRLPDARADARAVGHSDARRSLRRQRRGFSGDDIDGEAAYDYSGVSVSLSADGTALAVGASGTAAPAPTRARAWRPGTTAPALTLAAGVFAWDSDDEAWKQRGDIDGEAADDYSGYSVSLSADGTALAVRAPYNDGGGTDAGHACSRGTPAARRGFSGVDIDGEAANDYSGYSVSLSADGTALAVGAHYNDGGGTGGSAHDLSGWSVSLSADGTMLAVGASGNDGAGSNAGHARVFAWDPVDETWKQRGDDIDGEAAGDESGSGDDIDGEAAYDQSGYSVSLSADGTALAVGASGNDGAGSSWPRACIRSSLAH
ncbi:hypothetical protein JL720_16003 [Aureococcus anophagefferens]|nr:hypothetical protein JL720_16003 [Aureococcus anophagefferens]